MSGPFKLRSGNKSPLEFKQMGSSPAKDTQTFTADEPHSKWAAAIDHNKSKATKTHHGAPHGEPPAEKSPARDEKELSQEELDIIDIKKRIRQGDLKIGTKDLSGPKAKEAIRKELLSLELTRKSDAETKKREETRKTFTPSFPSEEEYYRQLEEE